jgi:tRNA-dihydrouridine synthase
MGCPDRNVEKQGAGAKLILNPELAKEIILATKKGAGKLPVSVKTRLGYNKNILDTWLPELLAAEPAAITIHCRTRKEMSNVPAHWEEIAKAVEIRNNLQPGKIKTLILGNGDATDINDALEKVKQTGCDNAWARNFW